MERAMDGGAPERGAEGLSGGERRLCAGVIAIAVAVWAAALWVAPAVRTTPALKWLDRPCALRLHTGMPCPLCGGTRSAALAARGDWGRAALLNPAGPALLLASAALALWVAACLAWGRAFGLRRARRALDRSWMLAVMLGLVLALWAYKIVADCWFGVG
jgi:hypothetical protein